MIFATIGNDHRQFKRFNELIHLIGKLFPNEEIIYQNGYTPFNSELTNISNKAFIKRDEFRTLLEKSSLVFTHAGAGTLLQLTKLKKIPLVLPRLFKFSEHLDNHQKETLNEFIKQNFALEIDYPFFESELNKKIELAHFLNKSKNEQINDISKENSLIKNIKKDIADYLKK